MSAQMPPHADSARSAQLDRARRFRALHEAQVLALPNAWDVASARLIEDAGAAAIATTSAGVSWSLGVPDGGHLTRDQAVDAIARIVAAVDVPVTADIEAGYGATLQELAVTVRAVLDRGAVGVNIEDSGSDAVLRPIPEQAERLAVVRRTADEVGVPLFINARTDTYLFSVGARAPRQRLAETLRRGRAYVEAGADGVFVPGVVDPDIVRRLAREVPAPLNVMAGPGAPSVAEFAGLGVRRVSLGSAVAQAAYTLAKRAAQELVSVGSYGLLRDGISFAELNARLASA